MKVAISTTATNVVETFVMGVLMIRLNSVIYVKRREETKRRIRLHNKKLNK